MTKRKEAIAAAAIAALLAGVLAAAASLGSSGRRLAPQRAFALARPADAYALWSSSGVRGRLLLHFDRWLITDDVPLAHPLDQIEAGLTDGNFILAAILSGRVREIVQVIPDDSWPEVQAALARRGARSALVVEDGRRVRTLVRSVPVTVTRLRDLPVADETALVVVNEALFDPGRVLDGVRWDLLGVYRRSSPAGPGPR